MKIKAKLIIIGIIVNLIMVGSDNLAKALENESANFEDIRILFDADQADRKIIETSSSKTWKLDEMIKVMKRDQERQKKTKEFLNENKFHTADDYYYAAMIFQHGQTSDDFLLAHILATLSLKLGREKSIWLVAASLDRYLMKIGQPQIFGSQFNNPKPKDLSCWTNEPYNQKLISNSVQKLYLQPAQNEIAERLKMLKVGKPLTPTIPK